MYKLSIVLLTDSKIFNFLFIFNSQAENTFILTLDGDVDFKPDAVRLLVDRLKKNKKVGAACGRIHPIGSGNHNKQIYRQHNSVSVYINILISYSTYLFINKKIVVLTNEIN